MPRPPGFRSSGGFETPPPHRYAVAQEVDETPERPSGGAEGRAAPERAAGEEGQAAGKEGGTWVGRRTPGDAARDDAGSDVGAQPQPQEELRTPGDAARDDAGSDMGARPQPQEELRTIVAFRVAERGYTWRDVESAFRPMPGCEEICQRQQGQAFFIRFRSPGDAERALESPAGQAFQAELAHRNTSTPGEQHRMTTAISVRNDCNDTIIKTLAVNDVEAKGFTIIQLQQKFEKLPGFVKIYFSPVHDAAFIRFCSGAAAVEALRSDASALVEAEMAADNYDAGNPPPQRRCPPRDRDRPRLDGPRYRHGQAEDLQLALAAPESEAEAKLRQESGVRVLRRGELEISMPNCGLDDAGVQSWCKRVLDELPSLPRVTRDSEGQAVASSVNFSENYIGDQGLHLLLSVLLHLKVGVHTLKLYRNCLGKAAAYALADWFRRSPTVVREAHLSHNCIPLDGFAEIFQAIARRLDYPAPRPGRGAACPMWLRIEYNLVADVRGLLWVTEEQLRKLRGKEDGKTMSLGGSGAGQEVPMVCVVHQWESGGCKNDWCRRARPGGACPVVHVTYPTRQHRQSPQVPWAARKWNGSGPAKAEEMRWHLGSPDFVMRHYDDSRPPPPPPPLPALMPAPQPQPWAPHGEPHPQMSPEGELTRPPSPERQEDLEGMPRPPPPPPPSQLDLRARLDNLLQTQPREQQQQQQLPRAPELFLEGSSPASQLAQQPQASIPRKGPLSPAAPPASGSAPRQLI